MSCPISNCSEYDTQCNNCYSYLTNFFSDNKKEKRFIMEVSIVCGILIHSLLVHSSESTVAWALYVPGFGGPDGGKTRGTAWKTERGVSTPVVPNQLITIINLSLKIVINRILNVP